ncbi:MAG TPA: hypothetical protein VFE13_04295 [Caulobacteraceae bacterium]|jgi:hypothetical protein|nr:hypothetical protein [Caulobacteraceae bacterium]
MRWALGVAVFIVVVAAVGAALFLLGREPARQIAPPPEAPPMSERLPPPAAGSQWRYTQPKAASVAEAGVEACTRSAKDLDLGGGKASTVRFCLRRGGGYPYAGALVLGDMGGRFACAGCPVRVRFDGGMAQSFEGTTASSDGSAYAITLGDGARLAAEVRRASRVTFTVMVQGVGQQEATFDIAGLRWGG